MGASSELAETAETPPELITEERLESGVRRESEGGVREEQPDTGRAESSA